MKNREITLTKETMDKIAILENNMDELFNSYLWIKIYPVLSIIVNKSTEKISILDFANKVEVIIYTIFNKFGYNISMADVETMFDHMIIKYYHMMQKYNEEIYLTYDSYKALLDFFDSIDEDDVKAIKPIFDKIVEKIL